MEKESPNPEVWERKDRLSMAQSALKATSTINEGTGKGPDAIKMEADVFYQWLEGKRNQLPALTTQDESQEVPDFNNPQWKNSKATGKSEKVAGMPCPDCNTPFIAGKNNSVYCKPCYIKWAENNKN